MKDYITLLGAEQVQSAASTMSSAADRMASAAASMQDAVDQQRRTLEDFLVNFERIMRASNANHQ